jgi:cation-transporting P-type ATPase 13A2
VPFVVTIVVTLLMSLYMLLDPAEWLSNFMDLTEMSLEFELILLVLAAIGFAIAYVAERRIFPTVAKYIGRLKNGLRPSHQRRRKRYKIILEGMAA